MNQEYYLPEYLFYYYITWPYYFEDFTWADMDNTWNV